MAQIRHQKESLTNCGDSPNQRVGRMDTNYT